MERLRLSLQNCLIFFVAIQIEVWATIMSFNGLLFLCMKAIDFYMLISWPVTLLEFGIELIL